MIKALIWLVGIILLGFALRLYHIDTESLWYDETVSAFLAGQPALELITHTARDIHPPGYYLLLHYWAAVTGQSQFALAFFSLSWGMLLIPLTYALARRLVNKQGAIWAALFVAVSPFNIWYSQEVRMYTLGAALGLIAIYNLLKAVESDRVKPYRYLAGYLGAASLGLYTLYYFVFLLITVNLFVLISLLRYKSEYTTLKRLASANLLVLAAYLPWLPIAWRQATNPPVPAWRSPPNLWQLLTESWTALSLGQSVDAVTVWPVLIVIIFITILGLVYLKLSATASRLSPAWLLLSYIFGPLLLIYLFSFITPLYHVRYLFTYSPAFYVILGAGLVWLNRRINVWAAVAAAGIMIAASGFSIYQIHFNPTHHPDDYRSAVAFIQERWQPGDLILINAGYTYTAFLYYADAPQIYQRHRLLPYASPANDQQPLLLTTGTLGGDANLGWGDPHSDFYAMDAASTTAALTQLSADFSRLWLLRAYDTVTDPLGLIRAWLAEHTIPIEDQPFSGPSNIRVQAFLLNGSTPPEQKPVPFADGMLLAGWRLPHQSWRAGQTIPIQIWWSVTAAPGADYKASLKLWTPSGDLAAQGQDEWPAGSLYRATAWPVGQLVYHPTSLKLPPDLPAGQYWLNLELYHPDTIQPLPRQDNAETVVTLGPITVDPT